MKSLCDKHLINWFKYMLKGCIISSSNTGVEVNLTSLEDRKI